MPSASPRPRVRSFFPAVRMGRRFLPGTWSVPVSERRPGRVRRPFPATRWKRPVYIPAPDGPKLAKGSGHLPAGRKLTWCRHIGVVSPTRPSLRFIARRPPPGTPSLVSAPQRGAVHPMAAPRQRSGGLRPEDAEELREKQETAVSFRSLCFSASRRSPLVFRDGAGRWEGCRPPPRRPRPGR